MADILNITGLGKLEIVETYVYYDQPVLFSCKSAAGHLYLGVAADKNDENETWLYVGISAERLNLVRSGAIDLHNAFAKPEDSFLLQEIVPYDDQTQPRMEPLQPDQISKDMLPTPGECLNLETEVLPILSDVEETSCQDDGMLRESISVEVVDLSTTDYPNQEALNKALNIYRTCMRGFIIFHLQKIPGTNVEDVVIDSVNDWRAGKIERKLNEGMDIKSIIDIDDFPILVVGERGINWKEVFKGPLNEDKDFQNQLWLIKTCRDQSWAHPPEGDAESEGTRAYLFLIAEVLRKIKRPDKQCEIEAIRDELFFDDSAERLEKAKKDIAEYKRSLTETEQRLAAAEAEKKEYEQKNTELSEQIDAKEKQRKELDGQLKEEKKRTAKLRSDLSDVKKRLEESEAAQAEYQERFEAESKKLKEPKEERKEFKATKTKSRKKNMTIAERFVSETTEDTRNELARKVVELRINATGSRPTSWKRVRAKLDLANDHFHKVIRPSKGYREAVIARIKFLKAQEGGWEYSGKLDVLTGIDDLTEEELA